MNAARVIALLAITTVALAGPDWSESKSKPNSQATGATQTAILAAKPTPKPQPPKTLVVIVPGTWANNTFWPCEIEGWATFGSELKAGLGPGGEIYPFLWASNNDHNIRMEAAENLAKVIDERAERYDRVCLVGFSHGGNIALWATHLCKTKIDTVVCLGTPHVHLATRAPGGEILNLPVYCSPRTVDNTKRIVSVTCDTDVVASFWATVFTGMTENTATHMTRHWQEQRSFPRLVKDGMFQRLLGMGNLSAQHELCAPKTTNVLIKSHVKDPLGIQQHMCIVSRRMGRLVGELIHDDVSQTRLDYLKSMVIPKDSDSGHPVSLKAHRAETERLTANGLHEHAGWLVTSVSVHIKPTVAKPTDYFKPDPLVCLVDDTGESLLRTPHAQGSIDHQWKVREMIPRESRLRVAVWDNDVFFDDSLGSADVSLAQGCAATVETEKWRVSLTWLPVHY